MGLIPQPKREEMTVFTQHIFDKFRAKIKEVKDINRIMDTIKQYKKEILTNIQEERDFKVNIKLLKYQKHPKKEPKAGEIAKAVIEEMGTMF